MSKLNIAIIGVVVLGAAIPLVLQHQAQVKLRADNQALQQQVEELSGLSAENERLSNLVARSQSSQSLADERLAELVSLRSTVTALRAQTNALGRVQEENRRLQSSLAQARQTPVTAPAAEAPPQTDFPKDKWAFAGYATPEAAALSLAWAALNGDVNTITNSVTAEVKAMMDGLMQQGKFESEFMAGMTEDVKTMSTYKIVGREILAADQIRLTVAIPGKGNRMPILKRVGNEWKFVTFQ